MNEICKNVIPGMHVNVTIEVEGMQVAAIPSEAVVSFEGTDYIFVFDKNERRKRQTPDSNPDFAFAFMC